MKPSTKALLFSAFVFPGSGHFILKQRLRGWVYIIVTVGAFALLMQKIMEIANKIANEIVAGSIPLDPAKIMQLIHQSVYQDILLSASMGLKVLIACWLMAIFDCIYISWRDKC
ncbi:hypothetical protein JQC92_05345 [Shewanella sp. 202IG2-18]|uniref:hypothetical protein n=1 Tax=Parashewanella hymeniacidonis TaxID=2807618 RepID=UPI0019606689|nr:hypothetical protein [Parashewanella hymeniacidonis]MBM7071462.1 hypothetical protein [Parashewanella hymeniacidonis]